MKVYFVLLIMVFSLTTNALSQVQFASHPIVEGTIGPYSVFAADVDGDGDMDVLSASQYDDKIAWYENDGNEYFPHHAITTNADGAQSVYAVDVDGDGDMDVLSASNEDNKIAWYENDGNQNFSTHIITTNADGAQSVHAVDVDGDGDMDVLSASQGDHKVAWYENLSTVGFAPNDSEVIPLAYRLYNNYPNPFNPSTIISYTLPQSGLVQLKVFDMLGCEVANLVNKEQSIGNYEIEFNASNLSSGIYLYRLQSGSFTETKKLILLR